MSFTSLGLSDRLSETTKTLYETPTNLQEQAIPLILSNNDLMVAAPSVPEVGKIGSFVLPIIDKLFSQENKENTSKQPKVLILVASSNEAIQVTEYFKAYSFDFSLTVGCVLDNTNSALQTKILSHGVDVLVASPIRLSELIEQNIIELSNIEFFVLDEAEQLTNEEYIKTTKKVIEQLPSTRQNLLYATSFTDDVIVLAHFLLNNPERIEITITPSLEHIKQSIFNIPTRQKSALLAYLLNKYQWPQVLVFTKTKYGASRLTNYLSHKGISVASIQGNKTQNVRCKSLEDFKEGFVRVLIATDIATEELELTNLACVINFDLPYIEDDYIQRIKAIDNIGEVISFASPEEEKLLLVIENFIKQKITDGEMNDFVFIEEDEENQDRFKRIFRHPAVGRKSRKKTVSEEIITDQEDDLSVIKKELRGNNPPNNQAKTKTTRNFYNKHRRNPTNHIATDEQPLVRPDDEFRDDDYDNFGNSVDYISPYQKKDNNPNKRFTKTTSEAPTTTKKVAPRTSKPVRTTNTPSAPAAGERRPRNSLYRRNNRTNTGIGTSTRQPREIMSNTPGITNDFQEPQKRNTPISTPSIIHRKHPRIDKLPTMEQLDSLPNRHIQKTEKPMLLSRKNTDNE